MRAAAGRHPATGPLPRAAAVGEHGDVGDGVGVASEERSQAQFAFEDRQRALRCGLLGLDDRRRAPGELAGERPVAQRADHRLHPLLFEAQPLPHLGAAERVAGQVGRALRQVHQDCVGLGQRAPILQLDRRHRAGGADAQVVRALAFTLEDAHLDRAIRPLQVLQQLAHFPGVLRGQVVEQGQHGRTPVGSAQCRWGSPRGPSASCAGGGEPPESYGLTLDAAACAPLRCSEAT